MAVRFQRWLKIFRAIITMAGKTSTSFIREKSVLSNFFLKLSESKIILRIAEQAVRRIRNETSYAQPIAGGAILGIFLIGGATYKLPLIVTIGLGLISMMFLGATIGAIAFYILAKTDSEITTKILQYIPVA